MDPSKELMGSLLRRGLRVREGGCAIFYLAPLASDSGRVVLPLERILGGEGSGSPVSLSR